MKKKGLKRLVIMEMLIKTIRHHYSKDNKDNTYLT